MGDGVGTGPTVGAGTAVGVGLTAGCMGATAVAVGDEGLMTGP